VPWLLVAAAVAAFLAHEPWEVLRGGRGERVRRAHALAARRRLIVLLTGSAVAGVAALLLASPDVRWLLAVPAALALVLVGVAARGRSKSLGGELLSVATFAAMVPAIAGAGGGAPRDGWSGALVWLVLFGIGTLAVHAIKGDAREGHLRRRVWVAGVAAFLVGGLGALAAAGAVSAFAPLATAGAVGLAIAVAAADVRPRRLRQVGWTLAALSVVTLAAVVLGAR